MPAKLTGGQIRRCVWRTSNRYNTGNVVARFIGLKNIIYQDRSINCHASGRQEQLQNNYQRFQIVKHILLKVKL